MASFELVSFLHPDNPPGRPAPAQVVVNDDMHLIHTLRGEGTARIGSRRYSMKPGSVLFIEPHTEYAVALHPHARLEMLNFHFHLFVDAGIPFTRTHALPTAFRPRKIAAILRDLRRWHRVWLGPSSLERAAIVAHLHALVLRYVREFPRPPAMIPPDPSATRLAQLLRQKDRAEFDADVCARELFMSVSQMNRRFRQSFGASPKDFWLRHRYLLARARLHYTPQSISVIARELGFSDANYFSRWFKSRSGVAPQAFRKKARPPEL